MHRHPTGGTGHRAPPRPRLRAAEQTAAARRAPLPVPPPPRHLAPPRPARPTPDRSSRCPTPSGAANGSPTRESVRFPTGSDRPSTPCVSSGRSLRCWCSPGCCGGRRLPGRRPRGGHGSASGAEASRCRVPRAPASSCPVESGHRLPSANVTNHSIPRWHRHGHRFKVPGGRRSRSGVGGLRHVPGSPGGARPQLG